MLLFLKEDQDDPHTKIGFSKKAGLFSCSDFVEQCGG
jgi:hypothetical protein